MTTLSLAPGDTAYWTVSESNLSSWIQDQKTATLPDGAIPYIPITRKIEDDNTTLDAWKLISKFHSSQNFQDSPSATLASLTNAVYTTGPSNTPLNSLIDTHGIASFTAGVTVYIPLSLTSSVTSLDIPSLSVALSIAHYGGDASTSSTTGTGEDSAATSSPTGTPTVSETYTSDPVPSSSTPATSGQNTTSSDNDDDRINVGAIAGGTVGGVLFGMLACGLIWLLWRRRRPKQTDSILSQHRRLVSEDAAGSKEVQLFDMPTTVTGWQKHLPQEKDDRAIANTFQAVFDQVQIHVEGSYNAGSGRITSEAIAAIERIGPTSLATTLKRTRNSHPLLEAVLIRWIVHRISLRSDAGDSFFPFAYTKIPEVNRWHMESDEHGNVPAIESKKGFPQAFSQWRVLTAFLHPDPRTEQEFKKTLDIKIDRGVEAFAKAFSPWAKGGSEKNRKDSLRRILELANGAGLSLFAQQSTFMFDWSERDGTVTVSPALVKRLDKSGKLMSPAPILISPRRLNVEA